MRTTAEKALIYGRVVSVSLVALILAAVLGLVLHFVILVVTG